MKIVALSDIHEQWHNLEIPTCDILISAGDYSYQGKPEVVQQFHAWLDEQPATHIISVQGNHEKWVERNFEAAKEIAKKECPDIHFIQHEAIEIEGIKIFGSAWTPYFCNWAWNAARNKAEVEVYNKPLIDTKWADIPDDTNILITHGPPFGILDYAPQCNHVGCHDLLVRVQELKDLKHHIFGHIHYSHGSKKKFGVEFHNASICTESYRPNNPITIIDYEQNS